MSREYMMDLLSGEVNVESKEQDLFDIFSCINNEDLNGNNGEEFLSEEAVEGGFYSDIELSVRNVCKGGELTVRESFEGVCEEIMRKDSYRNTP